MVGQKFFLKGRTAFLQGRAHNNTWVKVLTLVKPLANQIAQIGDLIQSWGLRIFKALAQGSYKKKYFFDPKLIFPRDISGLREKARNLTTVMG